MFVKGNICQNFFYNFRRIFAQHAMFYCKFCCSANQALYVQVIPLPNLISKCQRQCQSEREEN